MNTINVTGIGRLEVKTTQAFVELAGAIAADGRPVNLTLKQVSSSAKHRAEAERNGERYHLQPVRHDVFVLRDLRAEA